MSCSLYQNLLRPLLFRIDAERVHHLALAALTGPGRWLGALAPERDARLSREVFGVTFPNPVGLAAGFDKNAVALPAWAALGFGCAEVGTITARMQSRTGSRICENRGRGRRFRSGSIVENRS